MWGGGPAISTRPTSTAFSTGTNARGSGPGASARWRTSTTPSVAITANAWWRTTASQRARSSDAEGGEVVEKVSLFKTRRRSGFLHMLFLVWKTCKLANILRWKTRTSPRSSPRAARALPQPPERLRGGDKLLGVPPLFVRVPPQRRLLVRARERVRAHAFRLGTKPEGGEVAR